MRWKNTYTHLLLVLIAGFLSALASGWFSSIPLIPSLIMRHAWLLSLASLVSLTYVFKQISKKADELSMFLFGVGGFFILMGNFSGPIVVLLGLMVTLYALYHYQHTTLQAPDLPNVKRTR